MKTEGNTPLNQVQTWSDNWRAPEPLTGNPNLTFLRALTILNLNHVELYMILSLIEWADEAEDMESRVLLLLNQLKDQRVTKSLVSHFLIPMLSTRPSEEERQAQLVTLYKYGLVVEEDLAHLLTAFVVGVWAHPQRKAALTGLIRSTAMME